MDKWTDGQAAKQKRLELSPILGKNWIAYSNLVRQGVLALKEIEKGRQDTGVEDVLAYAARVYPDPPPDGPGSGPGDPVGVCGGKTIAGGAEPRTDSDDAPGGEIDDKGGEDDETRR